MLRLAEGSDDNREENGSLAELVAALQAVKDIDEEAIAYYLNLKGVNIRQTGPNTYQVIAGNENNCETTGEHSAFSIQLSQSISGEACSPFVLCALLTVIITATTCSPLFSYRFALLCCTTCNHVGSVPDALCNYDYTCVKTLKCLTALPVFFIGCLIPTPTTIWPLLSVLGTNGIFKLSTYLHGIPISAHRALKHLHQALQTFVDQAIEAGKDEHQIALEIQSALHRAFPTPGGTPVTIHKPLCTSYDSDPAPAAEQRPADPPPMARPEVPHAGAASADKDGPTNIVNPLIFLEESTVGNNETQSNQKHMKDSPHP